MRGGEGALFGELAAPGFRPCAWRWSAAPTRAAGGARSASPARGPDVVVSRGVSGQLVADAIARRAGSPHVVNEHTPLTADGRLLPCARTSARLTRLVAPAGGRRDRGGRAPARAAGCAGLPARADRGDRQRRRSPGASAGRAARSAGEGEFGVLCVSRLEPEKRVDMFVRAVAAARRSEPRVRGLWPAAGRERARVEALAATGPGWSCWVSGRTCRRCSPAPTRSRSRARPRRCRSASSRRWRWPAPWWRPTWAAAPTPWSTARPACSCPPGTRPRSSGRCSSWRAIRSGRGGWARPAARASASASTPRRWRTPTCARSRRTGGAVPDVLRGLARHHARLARGRPLFIDQLRAAGAERRGGDRADGRERADAAGLPGERLGRGAGGAARAAAALRAHRPRALVISTTTAAMLADPGELPYAVRLDAPARLNRPGARNAALRALERRALRRARLVLPWSERGPPALPAGSAPAVVLPPPVERSGRAARGATSAGRGLRARSEGQGARRGVRGLGSGGGPPARGSRCSAWSASRAGPPAPHGHPAARERRVARDSARRASSARRCGVHGCWSAARAGRTSARRRSRRWRTAPCWPPCPPGGPSRRCRWRAGSTRALVAAAARHRGLAQALRAAFALRRERGATLPRARRRRCWRRYRPRRSAARWPRACCRRLLSRRAPRRSTARSKASASASSGWRAVTARLPAASRSRSRVAHQPAQGGRDRGARQRVHQQRVSPSTAKSPAAPARLRADQRQAGGRAPRAPPRRRARRCSAAPARRPPRRARAGRPGPHSPRTQRHAQLLRQGAQLAPPAGPVPHSTSSASRRSPPPRTPRQAPQVLVLHQAAHVKQRAPGRRLAGPRRPPRTARGRRSASSPRTAPGSAPSATRRSPAPACEATTNPSARPASSRWRRSCSGIARRRCGRAAR